MEVHVSCQGHEKENLEIEKERIEEFIKVMKESPDYLLFVY